jgi:hypothetical protein
MANGYRGAKWPTETYLVDLYGGPLAKVYTGYNEVRGELRAAFDKRVGEIQADPDLTLAGKSKKLRALAEQFRNDKRVTTMQADLVALKKHEAALREKLFTRPQPDHDKLSPYAAGVLLRKEDRIIGRFEAMSRTDQFEAVRGALEKHDSAYLSVLLREGLLDDAVARRVEMALAREADPDTWREIEILGGKRNFDAQPDPLTSTIAVGGQALDLFLEHVESSAGIPKGETAALAAVSAADKGDRIEISPEQGHDVQLFRHASARAAEKGIPLRISGDEGSSEVAPGGNGPGSGE